MSENRRRSSRVRHQVERLGFDNSSLLNGDGESKNRIVLLGKIESLEEKFEQFSPEDELMKNIHLLLYGKIGTRNVRVDNIKKFSGFKDANNEESLNSRAEELYENKKLTFEALQRIGEFFDIQPSDSKQQMAKDIIDFLAMRDSDNPDYDNVKIVNESTMKEETKDELPEKKRKRVSSDNSEEQKMVTKKRRSITPFSRYAKIVSPGVKKEHPKWKTKRVNEFIKGKWEELSETDKKQYEETDDIKQSEQSQKDQNEQLEKDQNEQSEKEEHSQLETENDINKDNKEVVPGSKDSQKIEDTSENQQINNSNELNQENKGEGEKLSQPTEQKNTSSEKEQSAESMEPKKEIDIQTENNVAGNNLDNDTTDRKSLDTHVEGSKEESNSNNNAIIRENGNLK